MIRGELPLSSHPYPSVVEPFLLRFQASLFRVFGVFRGLKILAEIIEIDVDRGERLLVFES